VAEKCLTESDWKSFAKGEKLDDSKEASKDSKALYEAVLEALQELRDLEKARPNHDELLAALKEVEGVLTKQVAANARRKDKDGKAIKDTRNVKDQLYRMLAAVETERKAVGAAKDAKEEAEEEESPELLTTKMIPLIRQLRNGDLVMQSLIAVAGKETVVLLSRKAISPSRGKMLKEQMTNPGGLKFIRGECRFEDKALTFVVQAAAAGLAKRIKAALLAQTELRLKVRVRGEDADDVEEDGDDAEQIDAADKATTGTKVPAPPDPARLAFAQRLLKLKVGVDKAVTRGDAQAARLQALLESARQKVKAGDTSGGNDELTTLEKLLSDMEAGRTATAATAATTAVPGTASGAASQPKEARPGASIVQLQAARLGWMKVRKSVEDDLGRLSSTIRSAVQSHNKDQQSETEYDDGELEDAIKRLDVILEGLDTRLVDALDQALAVEGEQRLGLQRKARDIVSEYQGFVAGNALIHAIDANPFQRCEIRSRVDATLNTLAKAL